MAPHDTPEGLVATVAQALFRTLRRLDAEQRQLSLFGGIDGSGA